MTPIISIVGTARIAMIPKAIANMILANNLLILPCRFCGSFSGIKVFTVHLHDTGEIIIDHHDIVSTIIKLDGSFKVAVSIRFQFYYFAIHTDANCGITGFRFNLTE